MTFDKNSKLRDIRSFPSLIRYLRDEMGWPISTTDFKDLTFDYSPEELGIDVKNAAKIQEIKRLRQLSTAHTQPWGIFFVKFEPKRLPVVALRRILSQITLRKRASANSAERQAWETSDLLFISNYGEGEERRISLAHFSAPIDNRTLPTLKVLGWDNLDTPLHLDAVSRDLTEKLSWPKDESDAERWRQTWRSAFTLEHREVITTSRELSQRLASLAVSIRHRIGMVLSIESPNGSLKNLLRAFQEVLLHDLDEDGFADMYAQTIAYGLLSTRVTDPTNKSAEELPAQMRTNPFLKELMETFLLMGGHGQNKASRNLDFDELGISEVIELLDNSNMEAVVRDFGDRNPSEDPVIHFYEDFLSAYDNTIRFDRGVFYTPRPVVSYIVRSVDELLKTEFDLRYGLADTTTWAEIVERVEHLEIPDGVSPSSPFVQILDPATGTGTFLVETIDVIHGTMVAKWLADGRMSLEIPDLWDEYVAEHLLPRLHGFELLMAPYAIAHMKIGLKLRETGYRFGTDEGARVYLTNALEPPNDSQSRMDFLPALADESKAASEVKRNQRFTVIIGNPPYSFTSQNLTESMRVWVESYRSINGVRIKEKGALQAEKAIQDDYIKFMRLAESNITSSNAGIVGVISSHGYLDNPTLRGMRYSYLSSFDSIRIYDLHGNTTKKERSPDGSADKNVFDIKQGVSIALTSRTPQHERSGNIHYAELWGTRESKYKSLEKSTYASHDWVEAGPRQPFYLFKPQDLELQDEFNGFHKITEMMPKYGVGAITSKDHFVVGFESDDLVNNASEFRDSNESNQALCDRLGISRKDAWNVRKSRDLLQKETQLEKFVKPILYRPFDNRLIFYHPSLVWSMSRPTMQHMVDERNLAFAIGRAGGAIDQGPWNIVLCADSITDLNLYRRGGNSVFPLYLNSVGNDEQRTFNLSDERNLNFSEEFLNSLSTILSTKRGSNGLPIGVDPEDVFHYAYAVFYSPGYRKRYAEFLKVDFPRLPLTANNDLFRTLARVGKQLTAIHLLKSEDLDNPKTEFFGENRVVSKVGWTSDNGGTVWINGTGTRKKFQPGTSGFAPVPKLVWDFHIGGYQICEKWLKDRGPKKGQSGRSLTDTDVGSYREITTALAKSAELMSEIEENIEVHGGWPSAFVENNI